MNQYMGIGRKNPIDYWTNHQSVICTHAAHPFCFYANYACTRKQCSISSQIESSWSKQYHRPSSKTTATLPQGDNFQITRYRLVDGYQNSRAESITGHGIAGATIFKAPAFFSGTSVKTHEHDPQ